MSLNVCLSHDIDRTRKTFQYLTHGVKSLKNFDLKAFSYHLKSIFIKDVYWQFDKIIDIENKYGVKSSFFFLNESYPFKMFNIRSWALSVGYYNIESKRISDMIRFLDANGWEIGVHGSYLSYKDLQLLKKEKQVLEKIVGHPVKGIRQHFLNLNKQTWQLQKEAGFEYDSSYGNKTQVGFTNNVYHSFTPEGLEEFLVVPLVIMDSRIVTLAEPLKEACKIMDEAEKNDACLVINWHQRVFNKNEFPVYSELYTQIIEECKRRGAKFDTIGDFVDELRKK